MSISFANHAATERALPRDARAKIAAFASRVLAREGVTSREVTIVLGDDALLRDLYRRYKAKDRTTDVLSFTYEDGPRPRAKRHLEGEIYVSRQRLYAQAVRYRHSPGAELARLLTHGLLHLTGHDHMKAGERRVMRAAERAALTGDLGAGERTAFERLARAVAP